MQHDVELHYDGDDRPLMPGNRSSKPPAHGIRVSAFREPREKRAFLLIENVGCRALNVHDCLVSHIVVKPDRLEVTTTAVFCVG